MGKLRNISNFGGLIPLIANQLPLPEPGSLGDFVLLIIKKKGGVFFSTVTHCLLTGGGLIIGVVSVLL